MRPAKTEESRSKPVVVPEVPVDLVGTLVDGRYLVEREVGRGGFGIVYQARHVRFDSVVALKVFGRDDGAPLREGRLLFQLATLHPSFLRVLETGHTAHRDPRPYLVMEWLDGWTLKAYVDELRRTGQKLPLPSTLQLFDPLASALALAHAWGVSHRDLKPANIMLSVQGERVVPKLLDFGIAKVAKANGGDGYDDTTLGGGPFTPAYAAPEQWHRELGATGPWTDVYAFALLLTEVLAARSWCAGRPRTDADLARIVLDARERPTPQALGVEVPDSVEAVFRQALAVQPRERPRDVAGFWTALCVAADWEPEPRELRAEDFRVLLHGGADAACGEMAGPRVAIDTKAAVSKERTRQTGSSNARVRQASLGSLGWLAPWRVGTVGALALLGYASHRMSTLVATDGFTGAVRPAKLHKQDMPEKVQVVPRGSPAEEGAPNRDAVGQVAAASTAGGSAADVLDPAPVDQTVAAAEPSAGVAASTSAPEAVLSPSRVVPSPPPMHAEVTDDGGLGHAAGAGDILLNRALLTRK